jgi:hypothetical protein
MASLSELALHPTASLLLRRLQYNPDSLSFDQFQYLTTRFFVSELPRVTKPLRVQVVYNTRQRNVEKCPLNPLASEPHILHEVLQIVFSDITFSA